MKKVLFLFLLLLFPMTVFGEENFINHAKSGVLIEASSGKILYEKEKDLKVSVASMTKMVAQIIIMEEIEAGHIHWDDVVKASKNASDMGGSQIYLEEGEEITVRDLMKGISVASGNDATVAMAEYISGTEEKFVERMNQKVKELGLKNTHFVNSTGLDEENHYSSAYDMAMIARELVVNHSEILKFSSIYEDYLRQDSEQKFWLVNTNKLIRQYEGTDGLKTGHTDDAGYCLAATAKRGDLRLIGIVLGESESKVRNIETMELLDYGFQSVRLKTLLSKGTVVEKKKFSKANPKIVDIVLKDSLNVVEDLGNEKKYDYDIQLSSLTLPIHKGDEVGKIDVLMNGKKVSTGVLTVSQDVLKLSLFDFYFENMKNLFLGNY